MGAHPEWAGGAGGTGSLDRVVKAETVMAVMSRVGDEAAGPLKNARKAGFGKTSHGTFHSGHIAAPDVKWPLRPVSHCDSAV